MKTRGSETLERTQEAVREPAETARSDARRGRGWYAALARVGLVAKGLSYGLVGVLAIKLALGDGGKATSRNGALATLADESFGKIVIAALALGFAAYAIWRFVQALAEDEDESEGQAKSAAKKWGKRAGYVGRGAIYAGLTFSAVKLLVGSGGTESQNAKAHKTAETLFDWPFGRWLVGLAGLAILAAGLWNGYRGVTKKFEEKWRTSEMSDSERTWGGRAGMLGHLARGLVFGLIGVFVAKAAWEYDAKEAIGLDGALHKLAAASYGPWLLGLTAAGLVCYGLVSLVEARYRDVSTSSGGDGAADTRGGGATASGPAT